MRFNTSFLMGLTLLAPIAFAAPMPAPVGDKAKEHLAKCAATGLRYAAVGCVAAGALKSGVPGAVAGSGLALASVPFSVAEHRKNGQGIPEIKNGGYGKAIKGCIGDACKAAGKALGIGGRPAPNDLEMGRPGTPPSRPSSAGSFTTAHSHQSRDEKAASSLEARDESTPLLVREAMPETELKFDNLN